MGEMKSAFERALERVDKLGKMSPEEMRASREKEFLPVGQALAERYLEHGYIRLLQEDIDKYLGEEKDVVRKAALNRLLEAIDPGKEKLSEKAMEGVTALAGEAQVADMRQQITNLFQEYRAADESLYQEQKEEVEKREMALLHRLRISGSAVGGINLEASESWQEMSKKLQSRFGQRLQQIKEQGREQIGGNATS